MFQAGNEAPGVLKSNSSQSVICGTWGSPRPLQAIPEVKVIFIIIVRYLPFSLNLMSVVWSFPGATCVCYHNTLNAEAALRIQLLFGQTLRRCAKIEKQCHTFSLKFFIWKIRLFFHKSMLFILIYRVYYHQLKNFFYLLSFLAVKTKLFEDLSN